MGQHRIVSVLQKYRNQIFFVTIPLLLLPLPIVVGDQKSKCAYVAILMSLFWILQVLPLPITGYIPFLLLPMFEILTPAEVASSYFKDFSVIFASGFMISIAMEKTGLHKRLALNILIMMGSKQYIILIGFMFPTWFLSMWIPNTAVCVLMIYIAEEVVFLLKTKAIEDKQQQLISAQCRKESETKSSGINIKKSKHRDNIINGYKNESISLTSITGIPTDESTSNSKNNQFQSSNMDNEIDHADMKYQEPEAVETLKRNAESWFSNIQVCYNLAITYSATIGGTATIAGTPINLNVKEITDEMWQEHGYPASPITFTSWLILNLPAAAINLAFIWAWFCLHFFVCRARSLSKEARQFQHADGERVKDFLTSELRSMGRMRYPDYMVIMLMVSQILLWFFLEPDFMNGWNKNFQPGFVTMVVPAAMTIIISTIIPSEFSSKKSTVAGQTAVSTIGDWKSLQNNFPWGVLIMVGGGNALADAIKVSGLGDWISDGLSGMDIMPDFVIALVLCLLVSSFTEVIANIVAVNIFVPIAASLAENLGRNPLYLVFPVAMSASYSFVLPMAGAVNAYVLTNGKAKVSDSVKAGIPINIIAIFVTLLATHTWGMSYFDLNTLPWNITSNSTLNATFN